MIHDGKWIGRGQLEDDPGRWETLRYTTCDPHRSDHHRDAWVKAGRVSACGVSMRHNEALYIGRKEGGQRQVRRTAPT